MAVIVQLKSGSWRALVRRKGQYASQTLLRKSDADDWAVQAARDTNLRPETLHGLPNKPLAINLPTKPSRAATKAPSLPDNVILHSHRPTDDRPR